MKNNNTFSFEISLSVLNHLGRNLYRNFITVLGEAISNSWDADANNVWIDINSDNNFFIKDDGCGMNNHDFQNKFLKIGYSKRKGNGISSPNHRPYIGAKGIGKLALLSCAEKISVISKTNNTEYVGGVIDNSGLTKAIEHDLTPDKYKLGKVDLKSFTQYTAGHKKGTIIYFDQTKEDIKGTIPHLKKLIALYFRFSLIDESFKIFVNNEQVTFGDIKDLSDATEFLWNINDLKDPYTDTLSKLKNESIGLSTALKIKGFIATVEKPRNLKIAGTEEKIGIDLFVNGRLRERDILKYLPAFSTRHIASYLYGQVHFDELDKDGKDRFTSSRDGIIPGDEKYKGLIETLRNEILEKISNKWDELRLARDEDGDDENPRKTLKERRALSLYNLSSKDYSGVKNNKVGSWVKELQPDAEFNIPSYVDCFISENLIRKFIKHKKISLDTKRDTINHWKKIENTGKTNGNLTIDIRVSNDDIYYLDMENLVKVTEPRRGFPPNTLLTDETQFTPIRNAVMHTAMLTDQAKQKLTTVYENIKGKVLILLADKKKASTKSIKKTKKGRANNLLK
ncbi:MAG: ATP-binding protein [Minisyncoccia bacterium]